MRQEYVIAARVWENPTRTGRAGHALDICRPVSKDHLRVYLGIARNDELAEGNAGLANEVSEGAGNGPTRVQL